MVPFYISETLASTVQHDNQYFLAQNLNSTYQPPLAFPLVIVGQDGLVRPILRAALPGWTNSASAHHDDKLRALDHPYMGHPSEEGYHNLLLTGSGGGEFQGDKSSRVNDRAASSMYEQVGRR